MLICREKIFVRRYSVAYLSVVCKETADNLFQKYTLDTKNIVLKAYGNIAIRQVGVLNNTTVNFDGKSYKLNLYVMDKRTTLLGRKWLPAFGLWSRVESVLKNDVDQLESREICNEIENFKIKFSRLFGPGTGLYNGEKLELRVKEFVKR